MWAVLAAVLWVCALVAPQPLHLERDSFRRPQAVYFSQKRDQVGAQSQSPPQQMMIRTPRLTPRQYDVPQIGKWTFTFFPFFATATSATSGDTEHDGDTR